jgi:hypothetical protein
VANKRSPPSDSDSAALDELVEEAKFQAKLKAHLETARQKRVENIRVWSQWLTASVLIGSVIREGFLWLLAHIKTWLP